MWQIVKWLNSDICMYLVINYNVHVCAYQWRHVTNCMLITVISCDPAIETKHVKWLLINVLLRVTSFFGLCRTICRNTNAAYINIYYSSLQQKGDVILYILVQTSHKCNYPGTRPLLWTNIRIVKDRICSNSTLYFNRRF